jgi:hypothetical protein
MLAYFSIFNVMIMINKYTLEIKEFFKDYQNVDTYKEKFKN